MIGPKFDEWGVGMCNAECERYRVVQGCHLSGNPANPAGIPVVCEPWLRRVVRERAGYKDELLNVIEDADERIQAAWFHPAPPLDIDPDGLKGDALQLWWIAKGAIASSVIHSKSSVERRGELAYVRRLLFKLTRRNCMSCGNISVDVPLLIDCVLGIQLPLCAKCLPSSSADEERWEKIRPVLHEDFKKQVGYVMRSPESQPQPFEQPSESRRSSR